MSYNSKDDYTTLDKQLYPSIEASGNIYYGQTRKLALDTLFDKSDSGFVSYLSNENNQMYFNWRLGPFKDKIKVYPNLATNPLYAFSANDISNPLPTPLSINLFTNNLELKSVNVKIVTNTPEVGTEVSEVVAEEYADTPVNGVICAKYNLTKNIVANRTHTSAGSFDTYEYSYDCEFSGIRVITANPSDQDDNNIFNRQFFVTTNNELYVVINTYNVKSEESVKDLINKPLTFDLTNLNGFTGSNKLKISYFGWSFYGDSPRYMLQYKLNSGDWETPWEFYGDSDETATSILLPEGDTHATISIRRNPSYNGSFEFDANHYITFDSYDTTVELSGNINSLLSTNNFDKIEDVPDYAFYKMFSDATIHNVSSLVLPGKNVGVSSYARMFYDELSDASEGLAHNKYFSESPVILATNLSANSLNSMFDSVSSLNSVYCNAIQTDESETTNWLRGVSQEGVFHGHPFVNWTVGANGIPNSWSNASSTNRIMNLQLKHHGNMQLDTIVGNIDSNNPNPHLNVKSDLDIESNSISVMTNSISSVLSTLALTNGSYSSNIEFNDSYISESTSLPSANNGVGHARVGNKQVLYSTDTLLVDPEPMRVKVYDENGYRIYITIPFEPGDHHIKIDSAVVEGGGGGGFDPGDEFGMGGEFDFGGMGQLNVTVTVDDSITANFNIQLNELTGEVIQSYDQPTVCFDFTEAVGISTYEIERLTDELSMLAYNRTILDFTGGNTGRSWAEYIDTIGITPIANYSTLSLDYTNGASIAFYNTNMYPPVSHELKVDSSGIVVFTNGTAILPRSSGSNDLGAIARRFGTVYSHNLNSTSVTATSIGSQETPVTNVYATTVGSQQNPVNAIHTTDIHAQTYHGLPEFRGPNDFDVGCIAMLYTFQNGSGPVQGINAGDVLHATQNVGQMNTRDDQSYLYVGLGIATSQFNGPWHTRQQEDYAVPNSLWRALNTIPGGDGPLLAMCIKKF